MQDVRAVDEQNVYLCSIYLLNRIYTVAVVDFFVFRALIPIEEERGVGARSVAHTIKGSRADNIKFSFVPVPKLSFIYLLNEIVVLNLDIYLLFIIIAKKVA